MPKDWVIETPWTDRERLAGELGVAPIVAQVLFNRGVSDVEDARKFLNPRATDILPPETLPNCERAAERIFEAVRRGERIVIFGDYDVVIRKEGFQTLHTHFVVKAPWYEYPPLDFFADVLWPGEIHDRHQVRYTLTPWTAPDPEEVTARALELRNRALFESR